MSTITARSEAGTAPVPGPRTVAPAAWTKAATYLIGFGLMAAYLLPRGFVDAASDPAASMAFLLDHQAVLYLWYFVLYVVGGFALVVLVLGLDRLLRAAPATARLTTTTVGLLWAGLLLASGLIALVGQSSVVALAGQDESLAVATWSSVSVVQDALGGGIEIVGAVWIALLSVLARRAGVIGRGLAILGAAIAAAGAGTLVPAAADAAGSLFGLGFVGWFLWVGIMAARSRS